MAGLDRPADALDQSVDDRQPQPGSDAANAAIALVQRRSVERDSQIVVGQARAAVPNLDDEVRRGGQLFHAGRQDDRGTGRGDAQGVLEQAVEHLPQPGRIGPGDQRPGRSFHHEPNALRGTAPGPDVGGRVDDAADIDSSEVDTELLRIEPGEIQQISNEAGQAMRLIQHDRPDPRRFVRRNDAICERLGVAVDRRQRRTQVVGHRHQELPLPSLRLRQTRREAVQRVRHLANLGRTLGWDDNVAPARVERVRGRCRALERTGQAPCDDETEQDCDPDRNGQGHDEPAQCGIANRDRVRPALDQHDAAGVRGTGLDEHGLAINGAPGGQRVLGQHVGDLVLAERVACYPAGRHQVTRIVDRRELDLQSSQQIARPDLPGRGIPRSIGERLSGVGQAGQELFRGPIIRLADQPDGDAPGDHGRDESD